MDIVEITEIVGDRTLMIDLEIRIGITTEVEMIDEKTILEIMIKIIIMIVEETEKESKKTLISNKEGKYRK